jgi:hypothetical protein
MNPIITQSWTPEERARQGIRGMEGFSAEELALLQEKLDGWMGQRAHEPERPRRRPWVMPPHTAKSA